MPIVTFNLLSLRKAQFNDLPLILELLRDDVLGENRENLEKMQGYKCAFEAIQSDPNHLLMVTEYAKNIIGTYQLTFIPSLSHQGSLRMQIESVRVSRAFRGKGVGKWMIDQAVKIANEKNAHYVQLTSNKDRTEAIRFYESCGFQSTHVGLKLVVSDYKKLDI